MIRHKVKVTAVVPDAWEKPLKSCLSGWPWVYLLGVSEKLHGWWLTDAAKPGPKELPIKSQSRYGLFRECPSINRKSHIPWVSSVLSKSLWMVTEFLGKLSVHKLLLVPMHYRGWALGEKGTRLEGWCWRAIHAGTGHCGSHVLQEQKPGEVADVAGSQAPEYAYFRPHNNTAEQCNLITTYMPCLSTLYWQNSRSSQLARKKYLNGVEQLLYHK